MNFLQQFNYFFKTGGTDCYIVRLVKQNTGKKSKVILQNDDGQHIFEFTAKELGSWGNDIVININYETETPEDTFNLIVSLVNEGIIIEREEFQNCSSDPNDARFPPTLLKHSSNLVDCKSLFDLDVDEKGYSLSRMPIDDGNGLDKLAEIFSATNNTSRFQISIDGSQFYEIDLTDVIPIGINEADAINNIKTKINSTLPSIFSDKLEITFDTNGNQRFLKITSVTDEHKSIRIQPSTTRDVTKILMLGTDQGGKEISKYSHLRPSANGIYFDLRKLDELSNLEQPTYNKIILDGHEIALTKEVVDDSGSTITTNFLETVSAEPEAPLTNWKWYHGEPTQIEKDTDPPNKI